MIGTLSGQPTNVSNPGDVGYGIKMPDVQAMGAPEHLFRLDWYGNTSTQDTASEFRNGQFWLLERYDSAQDPQGDPASGNEGWSGAPGYSFERSPRNDLVNQLRAGDEYMVFSPPSGLLL